MINLDIKLNDFKLPVNIKCDSDYYDDLKINLNKYKKHMESIDNLELECKKNIRENCKLIIKAIELYYSADLVEAENCIYNIIEKYVKSEAIVANINENYAFKGMAPEKIQPEIYKETNKELYKQMQEKDIILYRSRVGIEKYKREDLLHIPFSKRGKISTQRFSMAGVPCLYLSATTFGAWLELGMPDAQEFQVSAFSFGDNLKVLNLCQQQMFINGMSSFLEKEKTDDLKAYLEIFPLVIASSYRVFEDDRKFKSEYIISQLIMQVIKKLKIDGVAYLSKKIEDYYSYPQCVNLAILIPYESDNTNNDYWSRISEIALTEPYTLQELRNEERGNKQTFINEIYSGQEADEVKFMEEVIPYQKSIFSKFDDLLYQKERKKVKI